MNQQQQIDKYEAEIKILKGSVARLKREQDMCSHQFDEPFYDPYEATEMYDTGNYERQGIHSWPITSPRKVTKKRWTRVCSKCGKREHTEKEGATVVKHGPVF